MMKMSADEFQAEEARPKTTRWVDGMTGMVATIERV
jgi:hypothetical protein